MSAFTREQIELRLKCVELAIESGRDPVGEGRKIFGFVTGEDVETPRQIITKALERAGVR
jgi:hypothetical protein